MPKNRSLRLPFLLACPACRTRLERIANAAVHVEVGRQRMIAQRLEMRDGVQALRRAGMTRRKDRLAFS